MKRFVEVVIWICLSCYMDLFKLLYVFLADCQTKPSGSFTKIVKKPWVRCAFDNVLYVSLELKPNLVFQSKLWDAAKIP